MQALTIKVILKESKLSIKELLKMKNALILFDMYELILFLNFKKWILNIWFKEGNAALFQMASFNTS